jgi:hypothetical protein
VALSSPFVGLRTSRRLHHRPLQVTRPPGGSVIALFRSTDLPASPSSSTSGPQTSKCLHRRRLLQVARPLGVSVVEGPIRRTREGGSEWEPIKILLEGDGNSNKMKAASSTLLQLATQVGQVHVATGVPRDLGTNTQPSDPRTQRNTKPRVYRPTPVRPVSTTGQTGPCW